MRKKTGFVIGAAVALALVGCGNSAQKETTAQVAKQEETTVQESETEVAKEEPVTITIWYEGNDSRLPFFKAAEAEMQKDYPNYSIDAITFDNSTLVTKSLQAVTTTGGVDLIFNEASRLLVTQQQSGGGFEVLDDVLAECSNADVITEADKKIISDKGSIVVFPANRSASGLGYKTDVPGVEVTEDKIPNTFDKFVSLGKEYKKAGIAGWTLSLASDKKQVLNIMLTGGNGINNVWINDVPESQIEAHKEYFEKIIDLYVGEDGFWDKDAINEDFSGMYTKIQSGSTGMFRVGNWNVVGWDAADSGVGEYAVTTYPSFDENGKGGLLLSGVRGMAMPKNAPNKEAAKIFLKYCMSEAAQKASFDTMGSCMDYSVVDKNSLTKNQQIFFDPDVTLYATDAFEGAFDYYPELMETFEKGLDAAFNAKDSSEIMGLLEKADEDLKAVIEENK